jgi:hypothetical protein
MAITPGDVASYEEQGYLVVSKAVKRVEKIVSVETKTIAAPPGPIDVKLFSRGGQLGLGELTDTGEIAFISFERIRTHRARSKAGTYRWHNDHRLPAEHGGGVITVRLHRNADDHPQVPRPAWILADDKYRRSHHQSAIAS